MLGWKLPQNHMDSKLAPLHLDEEVEAYDAFSERREINFPVCNHRNKVKLKDGILKCQCGAGWRGRGVHELYILLTRQ